MSKLCLILVLTFMFYIKLAYTKQSTKALDFGGGPYKSHSEDSRITEKMRVEIKARLKKSIGLLKSQGIIPTESIKKSGSVALYWPLNSTLSDYGYHRMGHFPDHDSRTNRLLDYMGGNRTYDRSSDGYDHQGTDFVAWPFSWHQMNNDQLQVVAAASGTIIEKVDGNYDKECFTLEYGNFNFNSIYIYHDDGSIAWYVHLKRRSLTSKSVGQTVEVGEFLGIVGSSGWSWEPHLHFELEDSHERMVDPNIGPYNPNPSITWAEGVQRPYYDSAINKVMTHSAPPDFTVPCPNPAIINAKEIFDPGDVLYVAAYYRDQLSTQVSQYTIYRPDNSVFQSWEHSSGSDPPHPSDWQPEWALASHWYWAWLLPLNAPAGTWKVEVLFEGKTYDHNFTVNPNPNNLPPIFTEKPFTKSNAVEDFDYSESIVGDVFDPESDPLSFSKISGPPWLNLADNGNLSGIPTSNDLGENVFVVRVEDSNGGSDVATMYINVDENPYDNSLYISLTSFDAESGDNKVYLSWVTQSEIDNLGFIIERLNEKNQGYIEIASYKDYPELKGQGNSSQLTYYSYIDKPLQNGRTYFYQLIDVDYSGRRTYHGPISATPEETQKKLICMQNYPNPFNVSTVIRFSLPDPAKVLLDVYNSVGETVAILVNEQKQAGHHQTVFLGETLPSGIYYYRLKVNNYVTLKKMILLR
jgi:murein DD-endopeptidase MepM/ murein hydrolase activator NlpD